MTVFILTCWAATLQFECGQYQWLERCQQRGPAIVRAISREYGARLRWRCEEKRA